MFPEHERKKEYEENIASHMPKHKRHSGYQLFGYLINQDWLIWYGKQNGCVPDITNLSAKERNQLPKDWDTTIVCNAVTKILLESGLYANSTVMEALYKGKPEMCITIATNKYGMVAPPPETWQRLKKILGVDLDPSWFPAYEDD
ncbi:hypothetical protein Clacol_007627 [Clathrus columnatus]|uniref:Uncharacterized protein n=1 Tax=Clathrus columnatus TaxID=1419009 RepID=A0AAV5AN79_9AGAM|nr:hypothetical protein Clacol_007627 [Clathrus columnatus]